MQNSTLHTSRYGMAVPVKSDAARRRGVTTLRWADVSDAMGRVVNGVRLHDDDVSPITDVLPAGSADSRAGSGSSRSAERLYDEWTRGGDHGGPTGGG